MYLMILLVGSLMFNTGCKTFEENKRSARLAPKLKDGTRLGDRNKIEKLESSRDITKYSELYLVVTFEENSEDKLGLAGGPKLRSFDTDSVITPQRMREISEIWDGAKAIKDLEARKATIARREWNIEARKNPELINQKLEEQGIHRDAYEAMISGRRPLGFKDDVEYRNFQEGITNILGEHTFVARVKGSATTGIERVTYEKFLI
ncbi:MAG: hypothetical protein H6618_06790 [Deltaproteobacteria bacterium]|nr:hypothetical protein [Deltaproteobacteria bacterium]